MSEDEQDRGGRRRDEGHDTESQAANFGRRAGDRHFVTGALAPDIRPGRALRWSWIWLVPMLAVLVALSLLVSVWVRTGPTITIGFISAAGIEAGQTKLRYRDVVIGEVTNVRVADDRLRALVDVQLKREGAEYITRPESKFWIVRPQLSLAGVSGLDTLLSGVYLSVDTPSTPPEGDEVFEFKGLSDPPEILSGQVGTRFRLQASTLGSLAIGSRVYYRRIEAGRVVGFGMAPDGRSVSLEIFVEAPYDRFVTKDTRFWNDSGIDVSMSTDGVELRTSGLAAFLSGGISFAPADESSAFDGVADTNPSPAGSLFTLFDSRPLALADPEGSAAQIEMRFDQSVRGLRLGAPVDFRGIVVGKVVDIDLEYDQLRKRFYVRVRAHLYPLRFSAEYRRLLHESQGKDGAALLDPLVQHGLRAQLRSSNLLTGLQYVSLEFFPDQADVTPEIMGGPQTSGYLLPTIQGDFDRIQAQVVSIVNKLDNVPVEEIGAELHAGLKALSGLLGRVDDEMVPQANEMLGAASSTFSRLGALLGSDAPLVSGVQDALRELDRAARALRLLAESLQSHPESLLHGRVPDSLR